MTTTAKCEAKRVAHMFDVMMELWSGETAELAEILGELPEAKIEQMRLLLKRVNTRREMEAAGTL